MEWIGLLLWVLAVAVALPLGRNALGETPLLGLQAMAAGGGLALCVLFLIADRPAFLAWASAACGVVATIAVAGAAAWLTDDRRSVSAAGQHAEEIDAALAPWALALLACATFTSAMMALDVGMVS